LFAPINRLKYNNSKLHSVTPPINRIEMQQLKMVKADTIVPLVDVEKGTFSEDESHKAIDDAPFEPYLDLRQIAELHPESRVDLANIENSAGLSLNEAVKRLITNGKNRLTPLPKIPGWSFLLKHFQDTLLMLLYLSAALSLADYFRTDDITNLVLAIVLAVVVDGYAQYLATTCTVIRDQKQQKVQVEQLVPGDLVLINNGDKVPADMVLLLCRGLKTEIFSLTGESEPIACTDRVSSVGTRMFECKNMAFNSSLCFDGTAIGLVVRTGDKTAISTIAKLASDTEQQESTWMQKVVAILAVTMAVLIITQSLCFFWMLLIRAYIMNEGS
jgi:magnesium-transporting ATPase (P-type)